METTIQSVQAFPSAVAAKVPPSWLSRVVIDWAAVKGLQMVALSSNTTEPVDKASLRYVHLPVSLLPTTFPKKAFHDVIGASPIFNELVDQISRNRPFLEEALAEVAKNDPFTGRLLQLYGETTSSTGQNPSQSHSLGIHRSDYMLDDDGDDKTKQRFLQVELNTIASSFGCLASLTAKLHRYLMERYLLPPSAEADWLTEYLEKVGVDNKEFSLKDLVEELPPNPTLEKLPEVIRDAHAYFGVPEAVVVFIVQPGERNIFDQKMLELCLWERNGLRVVRLTLAEVEQRCSLVGGTQQLIIEDLQAKVAVVYFRAGYTPVDYPTEKEWRARLLIELSSAIKCPTIGYQLAGTKKIQQLLCEREAMLPFLPVAKAERLHRLFTGMYSLGSDAMADATSPSMKAVQDAIARPHAYVLKPQREGGGNNIYDASLAEALQIWSRDKLSGHVLMQRIKAPQKLAHLLRDGEVNSGPAISELGIFSTFLGDTSTKNEKHILRNDYAGYLVRTKLANVNEGGVATGYAVLDSVLLT